MYPLGLKLGSYKNGIDNIKIIKYIVSFGTIFRNGMNTYIIDSTTPLSLADTLGDISAITISIPTESLNLLNTSGQETGNNSGFLLDAQFAQSIYVQSGNSFNFPIAGLDQSKTYTIRISGSRATALVRTSIATIGGVSKTYTTSTGVDGLGNTSDGVIFTGLIPNAQGEITIIITNEDGTYSYFGGFDLIIE